MKKWKKNTKEGLPLNGGLAVLSLPVFSFKKGEPRNQCKKRTAGSMKEKERGGANAQRNIETDSPSNQVCYKREGISICRKGAMFLNSEKESEERCRKARKGKQHTCSSTIIEKQGGSDPSRKGRKRKMLRKKKEKKRREGNERDGEERQNSALRIHTRVESEGWISRAT